MTIKSFVAYTFNKTPLPMNEQMFAQFEFKELLQKDTTQQSMGFSSNVEGEFITKAKDLQILYVNTQSKKVSKPELTRRLKAKVAAKEAEFGRKLKSPEKKLLNEAVMFELLPLSFADSPKTIAVVFTQVDGVDVILVGTDSYKTAENVLGLVRKAVGSLPVIPYETNILPTELMTQMVSDKNKPNKTSKFSLGEKLALLDIQGYDIKMGKGSVYTSPVDEHLNAGGVVTSLEFNYDGVVDFTFNDEGAFKAFTLGKELPEYSQAEEDEQQLDEEAKTLIEVGYVKETFTAMVECLDGFQCNSGKESDLEEEEI